MPANLLERKRQMQRVLGELSGAVEVVPCREDSTPFGDMVIRFDHSVRIKKASLRLKVWEEFREISTEPILYAFSYHVSDEADVNADSPIFRYECHPDVGEPGGSPAFENTYERTPHFHPDRTDRDNVRKLHFQFHRSERKGIFFALVNWLQVDLIRRFYGR